MEQQVKAICEQLITLFFEGLTQFINSDIYLHYAQAGSASDSTSPLYANCRGRVLHYQKIHQGLSEFSHYPMLTEHMPYMGIGQDSLLEDGKIKIRTNLSQQQTVAAWGRFLFANEVTLESSQPEVANQVTTWLICRFLGFDIGIFTYGYVMELQGFDNQLLDITSHLSVIEARLARFVHFGIEHLPFLAFVKMAPPLSLAPTTSETIERPTPERPAEASATELAALHALMLEKSFVELLVTHHYPAFEFPIFLKNATSKAKITPDQSRLNKLLAGRITRDILNNWNPTDAHQSMEPLLTLYSHQQLHYVLAKHSDGLSSWPATTLKVFANTLSLQNRKKLSYQTTIERARTKELFLNQLTLTPDIVDNLVYQLIKRYQE